MKLSQIQDKCRGSLVGGAIGDALGFEVEFISLESIRGSFGPAGITRYVLHDGVARFSDDTQMTLFTLEGLMSGVVDTGAGNPDRILPYIEKACLNWYKTQTGIPAPLADSWLGNIRNLWAGRAPGMTCMGALDNIACGLPVCNNSKGCGGVMRVAPIGIFAAAHPDIYSAADTGRLAAAAADITHKHIASTLASALLAITVRNCIVAETVDRTRFASIVTDGLELLKEIYPGNPPELQQLGQLIRRALEYGKSAITDDRAVRLLGQGWVGDEALAIAMFSVMRHIDSFEDCIVCAVNHSGDSDSTGAVAGNIIGAILGYSAIPDYYIDDLEISPVLVSAADDLCEYARDNVLNERITRRYTGHIPADVDKKYLII